MAKQIGFYENTVFPAWPKDEVDYQQIKRRRNLTPNVNATFYYAVSFFPRDGYAIKSGATVNTLTAGP